MGWLKFSAMSGVLLLSYFFSSMVFCIDLMPALTVSNREPLELSVFEQGKIYDLLLPKDFMHEIEGAYNGVDIIDLSGDGVGEVIFRLAGGGVNSCSRVLQYTNHEHSLSELVFKGGLCNFKVRNGYVISSFRDEAVWSEDVYAVKNGKTNIVISDRCVGCGEVNRKKYLPDGSIVKMLVSDSIDFEKRTPLTGSVAPPRAWIFSSPDARQQTKKYLIRGDKVTLLGFYNAHGEDWIEFRFSGRSTTEGWLRCSDIESCDKL